ncbi:MAG: HEAT repeat domain-containing protein, partial [Deltaproteobacteria bacterium]|nr:HEAT repeat domain-containing protein [Deltaproteobacteria bacterium]
MRILAGLVLATLAATKLAAAQPADVPGMIKFVETQPTDMDKSAWKEKRRDAARRLGQSKDKRAVPVLIKLADTETFDIIGEIAIEGLGNLGDQVAVPVLQKIANDAAREKPQRDLAKKALGKLGAATTPPKPGTGTGTTGTGTTGTGTTGTTGTG